MSDSGGMKQRDDSGTVMLMGVALVIILMFLVWRRWHGQLTWLNLWWRYIETTLLGLISPSMKELHDWIPYAKPSELAFETNKEMAAAVNKFMRWPFTAGLIYLGFRLTKYSILPQHQKKHSMASLVKTGMHLYPQIRITHGLELCKEPISSGPWAMAATEYQFARRYKLLEEVDGQHNAFRLHRERAGLVFIKQLGQPWRGINDLRPHEKALFAIFAMRIASDEGGVPDTTIAAVIAESTKLAERLAGDIAAKKPDYSWVKPVLARVVNSQKVAKIVGRHAYVNTVMVAMYFEAKLKGILPPNLFLWLKPHDRRLWYVLHGECEQPGAVAVKGDTWFPECSGVYSHYLAERKAHRRLTTPYVKGAVDALEEALSEFIPPEEH